MVVLVVRFLYGGKPRAYSSRAPFPYLPEMSPGSPTLPVMVIVIVQELELDVTEASTVAGSFVSGTPADPAEEPTPNNTIMVRSEAMHKNLISGLNVPSSHPDQGASTHKLPPLWLSGAAPSSQAVPNTAPPLLLLPRLPTPYHASLAV